MAKHCPAFDVRAPLISTPGCSARAWTPSRLRHRTAGGSVASEIRPRPTAIDDSRLKVGLVWAGSSDVNQNDLVERMR